MTAPNPTASVLITSYLRPQWLSQCLDTLVRQTRPAEQIVVVARDTDEATHDVVKRYAQANPSAGIELALVHEPGVLAANNVGMPMASGEILIFLDDDSTAPPRWIQMLLTHYQDPTVGGVGGRIVNHRDGKIVFDGETPPPLPQKIDRLGRSHVGQMHRFQGVHEVDGLVGSNMSFRRRLLPPCDRTLRGDAFRYETDLCLAVQRAGYRVLMDSEAVNEHWCAPRQQGPQRNNQTVIQFNNHYNETYVLAKHRRHIGLHMLYHMFWGFPRALGRSALTGNVYAFYYIAGTLRGFCRGMLAHRRLS